METKITDLEILVRQKNYNFYLCTLGQARLLNTTPLYFRVSHFLCS